ncbi:MAG: hypothetical protein ACJAVZ_002631, partial [Afipia broomeae]
SVACLIVAILVVTVVEDPTRAVGAARSVDEAADLVVFAIPKSANAAIVSILLPQHRIDMALSIQRGDEIISMPGGAIGEFPGAGKMKQDAIEVGEFSQLGQGFHGAIQDVSDAAKPKGQDNTMTIVKSVLG